MINAEIAFRFRATGAFLMAVAASGIGLLASVQYTPATTVVLAGALLIPAVMTWFAWQPHETIGSIATWFISRLVLRPTRQLYEGTTRIAAGDLETEIDVRL